MKEGGARKARGNGHKTREKGGEEEVEVDATGWTVIIAKQGAEVCSKRTMQKSKKKLGGSGRIKQDEVSNR